MKRSQPQPAFSAIPNRFPIVKFRFTHFHSHLRTGPSKQPLNTVQGHVSTPPLGTEPRLVEISQLEQRITTRHSSSSESQLHNSTRRIVARIMSLQDPLVQFLLSAVLYQLDSTTCIQSPAQPHVQSESPVLLARNAILPRVSSKSSF